jgi:hypothetical protein
MLHQPAAMPAALVEEIRDWDGAAVILSAIGPGFADGSCDGW